MKKAAGVIASGVVSIVGSVLTILLGVGIAATSISMRAHPLPQGVATPPFDVSKVLLAESIVLWGLGIFGIICAIGLLRLKNWARVSFLVFGGLLGFFSIMGMIGTSMALLLAPQMAARTQGPPPGFLTVILAVFIFFWLVLAGVSAWWLYYFTRRNVKERFLTEVELATPRRGPLSITIIAWLLAIGGCLGSLALLMSYPVFLFGMVFHGWTAHLVLALFILTSLVAGVGMLRWHPLAHTLALVFYGFSLLSTIATLILPGSVERMQAAVQEIAYSPQAPLPAFNSAFMWFGMFFGVIAVIIPLWFLITRRRAFLEACITG